MKLISEANDGDLRYLFTWEKCSKQSRWTKCSLLDWKWSQWIDRSIDWL